MPEFYGKYACSSRGSVIPMRKLAAAYIIGTNQRGIRPHAFNLPAVGPISFRSHSEA
jgi:hypothetical protein